MKIALTTKGTELTANLDPRFGRAAFFIIFDNVENKILRADENANIYKSGGAGISSAQEMIDEKIDVLITGALGPNAHNVLSAAGIKVYANEGCINSIEALSKLANNELKEISGPHDKKFK